METRHFEAVEKLVNVRTLEEKKLIIEAQRADLLTDSAELVILLYYLQDYEDDINATYRLEADLALLRRCRDNGIEAAFNKMAELQILHNEINLLRSPSDMPRRVMVCQMLLQQVDRGTQPHLWADLQFQIALSMLHSPESERADNLEQAISHFEQSLELSTHQASPQRRARTQFYLATAYHERIRGERAENLERAIHLYEQALQVYTRQAFPEEWTRTQNKLASAHRERLH